MTAPNQTYGNGVNFDTAVEFRIRPTGDKIAIMAAEDFDMLRAELRASRKVVNKAAWAVSLIQAHGGLGGDEAQEFGLDELDAALAEMGK